MSRILVVDDNAPVARVLARLLERAGYQASVAGSGSEALAHVDRESPDLILLDMMMPEMDGMEVLRRLSHSNSSKMPPVIVFSALDDPKIIQNALRYGARDYWVKASFRFEELPQRVAGYLAEGPAGAPEKA
jgi:two-component system OmpR family response regulator